MPASHRRHRVLINRRERVNDSRHGWVYVHSPLKKVWAAISPTLGGGRRERRLFGPTVEFEMNAMGIFHINTDIKITDKVTFRGEEFEVLAVVNSMFLDRVKFAALKSKPEVPGTPPEPPENGDG